MHFPDLTPYEYFRGESNANAVNVGWLSVTAPFPKGGVSAEFVHRLRRLTTSPVNLTRGSHLCELCPPPPKVLNSAGCWTLNPPPGTYGNGEIRVPGSNGAIYAAPILILHYVEAHQYVPPAEFVDAVLALT
jgi:hypothetical protein